ncbi:DNA polymerase/3'-5' exonuclease PolX [Candidatus Desulforudis audaxviator]|uniref:DNA polymerase beta n=1 Tax=Desulforudis audaxviator (strain MP104C) TaxID=477974 RepID=B1I432_DESAP|nr:DNA polymerase/3'-5' exonuclease PolX [Candidatus Desulforudis audaxviator]ACA59665.1 PHP C-terminal domain protein [Candidatus Desulforudis audaxviator MP104C]AZK59657.1 DNA polymerase/3'-5' exonuclease PolX [Candidatus Desulforudis audaxviator]
MKNKHVARILQNIGDILEIRGENPFRVRAYRRAAHSIEALGVDLAELRRADRLTDIPGVGRDLAGKITEILDTGTCAYYDRLIREIPAGIVQLLTVPGIGPRTARILYEELQISGLDELERLGRAGRLAELRGLGEKTQNKILSGLELVRRGRERLPLGRVYPFASALVETIRAGGAPVERISVAGSIRRFQDTVKDVDIVAASGKPEAVIRFFTRLGFWTEILEEGSTRAAARTEEGLRVDLRVVDPAVYGAALCYLTGSKAHNIRMRQLAAQKGLKLNEYGVFRDDRCIAGAEEDDVFAALELPFIPPELREDHGEIEAALEGTLPRLVEKKDLRGDFHVHSVYSDGAGTLEDIAAEALRLGLEWVGVCDHSHSLKIARGLSIRDLRQKIAAVRAFNQQSTGVKLLAGAEVEIDAHGRLDYPDEVLAELDLVLVGVHTGFGQDRETMTARIVAALQHPAVHVLAHPTGRLLGERAPYQVDMDRVIAAAARASTALEINAYPKRLDLDDIHARQAARKGAKMALGSDAHLVEQIGFLELGVGVARRAWLGPVDVLNTLGWAELGTALGKGKFRLLNG